MRIGQILAGLLLAASAVATTSAQQPVGVLPNVKAGGSANVKVLSHIPLGGFFRVGDLTIDQDPARPYAYVGQGLDQAGFTIVSLKEPEHAKLLYRWRIEKADQHQGLGGIKPRYFSTGTRTYVVVGMQFTPGTLDADLAAVIFDVTGLPDTSKVREVARIRLPATPGGVRDLFTYKQSDGRRLMYAAIHAPQANVYDLDALVAGRGSAAQVGTVPIPASGGAVSADDAGYSGIFVGYDPVTSQDKFYGAGRGGYFVYDVSQPSSAKLLTSVVGAAGVTSGSSIAPTPDGRYVITGTDYQYSPMRLFDLKPGLEGKTQTISRPVGAWTPDWHDAPHAAEVRWPLAFVSSMEDGLQVINLVDPTNPLTVGWYFTCECQHETGFESTQQPKGTTVTNGALGVDVRNADGLVVVSDANTGLWVFRMDGFGGWKGEDWAMPDVTRAQDWNRAPIKPKALVP